MEVGDGMLVDRSVFDILCLEGLGFPRWWLGIIWGRWRKLRQLERIDESIPPKSGVLPSWDGMID
jgi:hypothetical protein